MDRISGQAGYPAGYPAFLISGIRPDIKFDIRPDIRPGRISGGRISEAGYRPDIKKNLYLAKLNC